jgi:5-methylcytosine-specific restriction endonuclease McrA
MYIRKEIYRPEEFLQYVEMHHTKKDIKILDGDAIKLGSDRYKVFKFKGLKCKTCNLIGSYFAKERTKTKKDPEILSWHLNLYGKNQNGEEILFTKDHIIPKSKGGKDEFNNYDTMCTICNCLKGNSIDI